MFQRIAAKDLKGHKQHDWRQGFENTFRVLQKKADGDFQSAIFETRKDCPKVLQEN